MRVKKLLRTIRAQLALRTRLRRVRKALLLIVKYPHSSGLRESITYWRWSRAPVSRRMLDHNGKKLICRFGPDQSDVVVWVEVFDNRDNDCVDLETASWIIDAGANVGYTALWFAEHYPSSRIIAVEPDAENFEILCLNVAHEPKILPVRAAITPRGAPRQLVVGEAEGTPPCALQTVGVDSLDGDINESNVVDAIDIASLMTQYGIDHLDLLKMDIEGGERAVFDDCADWIDNVDAMIVEIHDRFVPGCSDSFARATSDFAIRDIGPEGSYRVYVRRESPSLVGCAADDHAEQHGVPEHPSVSMSRNPAEPSSSMLGRVHAAIGLRTRIRRARRRYRSLVDLVASGRRHFSRITALKHLVWTLRRPSVHRIDAEGLSVLARFGTNRSDVYVWHEIFTDGEYEVVDLVDPQWILDLGANVGYSAVWFAKRYPKAHIIAVEPDAANYEILLANITEEPRIHPIRAAVASAGAPRQRISAEHVAWGGAALRTMPVDEGYEDAEGADFMGIVDSIDVATLLDQFGIERLDLLKIDVEGAERDIFGSSEPWIGRVDAVVAELHDRFAPGCEEAFVRATADFEIQHAYGKGGTIRYVRRESPSLTA